MKVSLALAAVLLLLWAGAAAGDEGRCKAAREAYAELQAGSVMAPEVYPLTVEGAEVRAACGEEALPAPPGADTNPVRPRLRNDTPAPEAGPPTPPPAPARPPAAGVNPPAPTGASSPPAPTGAGSPPAPLLSPAR